MNDVFGSQQHIVSEYVFSGDSSEYKILVGNDTCALVSGSIYVGIADMSGGRPENVRTLCKIESSSEKRKTIPGFLCDCEAGRKLAFILKADAGTKVEFRDGAATAIVRKNFLAKESGLSVPEGGTFESALKEFYFSKAQKPEPKPEPMSSPGPEPEAKPDSKPVHIRDSAPELGPEPKPEPESKSAPGPDAELLKLDGSSRYTTDDPSAVYRVRSGGVYVLIAPSGKGLGGGSAPERARPFRYVCADDKINRIPALCHTANDHQKFRFLLVARGNAEVEVCPNAVTEELQKAFIFNREGDRRTVSEDTYSHEGFEGSLVEFLFAAGNEEQVSLRRSDSKDIEKEFENIGLITPAQSSDSPVTGKDALYRAVKAACRAAGTELLPEDKLKQICPEMTVEKILSASRIACRSILLDNDWYKGDCGAFISDIEGSPVAIVPSGWTGYRIYFAEEKRWEKLTAQLAAKVSRDACVVYRTFPAKKLTKKDIISFGKQSVRKGDLTAVLILCLVVTLIGVFLPSANQKIYDEYIPLGNTSLIWQYCGWLASFMIGNLLFGIVKSLTEYRIGSRIGYDLQNAAYYRIFNLPESFFRKHESADLALRLSCISGIANSIVSTVLVSGLGAVISLLYLWRMFKYAKKLAFIALLMLAIYALIIYLLSRSTIKYQSKIEELGGETSSKLYQYLSAVEKIRMSGSEERAAGEYLVPFAERQRNDVRLGRITAVSSTLGDCVTYIFSIVFYWIIVKKNLNLSTGSFMAFNSAFGSFSAAILQLMTGVLDINKMKPQFERFKPVIESEQEDDGTGDNVDELRGELELKNVKFAYDTNSANVLDGIDLKVRSGEYLGIVGRSGCGKSTLLKLLLGFESPTSGTIYYDGRDLRKLDRRSLRKRIGVVLQGGKLISGSIFENITITAPGATKKDVEAVIEKVGLKDDIANMPMGLETVLSEDSGTISGGQQQRILIARAIINNPSILFFDEATSALDNITQATVCRSLDEMNVTRIVIAHRLSTIKNCDRIIVLDGGRIAEQGNYEELMANGGLFASLAKRQLVDEDGE